MSRRVICSDAFMTLPYSAQALYYQLMIQADDDGFVDNGKMVMRMMGAGEDALDALLDAGFLIMFESGVICIRHWLVHNTIQRDRYMQTVYVDEFSRLEILKSREYRLQNGVIHSVSTSYPQTYPQTESPDSNEKLSTASPQGFPQKSEFCIQDDTKMDTTRSHSASKAETEDKISKDKISKDKLSQVKSSGLETSASGDESGEFSTGTTDDDKDKNGQEANKTPTEPIEPVDDETYRSWFKRDIGMGSPPAKTDEHPRQQLTPSEDMADKVGQLFRELLPLLPYAGVPDKLVVDIARAGKPLDYYQAVFERAAASSYLREPHGGKSWCCSITWLVKPENAEKVLSGKYDDFAKSGKAQAQEQQGVTMVNGVENGFDTSPMFEAALQRGIKTMTELKPTEDAQEAQNDDKMQ